MELNGKIIQILPELSGEGRNGTWRKKDFILETGDKYPKKVCVSVWGDKINQVEVKEGDQATAMVNVESREFKGRWYTDVKAWKLTGSSSEGSSSSPVSDDQEPPADEYDGEDPPF